MTNERLRRRKPASSPSGSAIKWASIILTIAASEVSSFNAVRKPSSSLPVRRSPPGAGSGATSPLSSARRFRTFSTRLDYTDDGHNENNGTDRSSAPIISKIWGNLFPSPTAPSDGADEQESVDDYLEFLDRRYKRLRSAEEETEIKPFSAIDWLLQGPSTGKTGESAKQQQEDALYVLGVAGLASQKLLQKKHPVSSASLRREHDLSGDSDAIDVTTTPASSTSSAAEAAPVSSPAREPSSQAVKLTLPLIRALYVIQHRRQMFIRFYTSKLVALRSASLRSARSAIVSAPASLWRMVDTVLEAGGGKKSLALTFTVLSALLLLLRPVFQAAVADGSVSV